MSDDDLLQIKGVFNRQSIASLRQQAPKYQRSYDFMECQLELAAKCGGAIVVLGDPLYPEFLANSNFCHAILYCIGDLVPVAGCNKVIAIVGKGYQC